MKLVTDCGQRGSQPNKNGKTWCMHSCSCCVYYKKSLSGGYPCKYCSSFEAFNLKGHKLCYFKRKSEVKLTADCNRSSRKNMNEYPYCIHHCEWCVHYGKLSYPCKYCSAFEEYNPTNQKLCYYKMHPKHRRNLKLRR